MTSLILSFMEKIHEGIDPSYMKEKEEARKDLQQVGLISTATLIGSLALGIFGIAITASGGSGTVVGLPLILISLPLCYFSFNFYKISENMRDTIDNPKEYQKFR